MKTRILLLIAGGIFLFGPAGIAKAGGMEWPGTPRHANQAGKISEASPPIMVPNEYLEYLEIEKGLETGSLTAPGVQPTTSSHARPAEWKAKTDAPVMVSNDFLEYLEFDRGIETGSLTAPGVNPTVIPGPSEMMEIPEGG